MTGHEDAVYAAAAGTVLCAVILGVVLVRAFRGRSLGFGDLLAASAGLFAGMVSVMAWGHLAWVALR